MAVTAEGIEITKEDVLKCISAVESSCKELKSASMAMKDGLVHLMGICSGNRFDQIKKDVDQKVDGLNAQIALLEKKTMPKLQAILAWVIKVDQR